MDEHLRSAFSKFITRHPGEGVYLTDEEIRAVVDEMNRYQDAIVVGPKESQ
jgi:hypothetical protein